MDLKRDFEVYPYFSTFMFTDEMMDARKNNLISQYLTKYNLNKQMLNPINTIIIADISILSPKDVLYHHAFMSHHQ